MPLNRVQCLKCARFLSVCVFICMYTQKYRAMAIYIYNCLKLTFASQLFPKYVVVIVCLKLSDAKNRNWSISLWEEPVKGRVSNHGTPLIRWLDEQLLHNVSVTSFKKTKHKQTKSQPNKKTCASCNVGHSFSGEVLGRQLSQFESLLPSRSDLAAPFEPVTVVPSVIQWRLIYQLKTIYFFSLRLVFSSWFTHWQAYSAC